MQRLNRKILVLVAAISLVWTATGLTAEPAKDSKPDIVSVRVRGQGIDSESALKDALRRALEKGGRLEIYSQSQTENYELIRDTILARVTGLIRDYKIVSQGEDPIGGYFVEIIARVDRQLIDATWGQVQILLEQMGRPKILVSFVERIRDYVAVPDKDQIEMDSLLGNKIEGLLVEQGFELVDKNQIESLKKKRLEQASLDQDTGTIRALASELGADLYIVGFARASGPQMTDAYGVKLFMWETDVTLKAFWSETGQVLFSKSEVGSRSGSRTPGAPGAKKAIEKAGDKLAEECLTAILEKWSRQAVAGGKVVLEVKGVSFRQMMAIQDGLKQLEAVREVRRTFQKPVAKFEIVTTLSAENFAELLSELEWPEFVLEIEDQKFNTIIAEIAMIERTAKPVKHKTAKPVIEAEAEEPITPEVKKSKNATTTTTSAPTN
ncbi:MAG: hypothetical protein GX629_12845 [Phycisphaerae bacterium]|nr:hypothetical protein [Phycisphaerae bacterium]